MSVTSVTQTSDGTGDFFTVSFTISGGTGNYAVNGNPSGPNFTSDPIACETAYSFDVSDGNTTQPVVGTTPACPAGCTADAGTMPATESFVCAGGSVSVESNGFSLGPDDVLIYVLHTGSGTTIENHIAASIDGTFSMPTSASTNTEYYISAVAGPNDGSGEPILGDACTSIAAGSLVVFLDPVSVDDVVTCDDDAGEFTVAVSISGGLPGYDAGSSYQVSGSFTGTIAAEGSFTIGPSTDGQSYSINVSDDAGCGLSFVSDIVECTKCPSGISAGTYNGSTDASFACEGGVIGVSPADFVGTDLGDGEITVALVYVLHSNASPSGVDDLDVVAFTTSVPASFERGSAAYNTMYYISAVVTPVDDNGDPDLGSGCAVLSAGGATGVFLTPIEIEVDQECDGDAGTGVLTASITGGLPGYEGGNYTVSGSEFNTSVPLGNNLVSGSIDDGTAWNISASDGICTADTIDEVNCEKVTAVEWVYFTGEVQEQGNLLKWGVASEIENDFYSVERSKDGESFEVIGTINGAGTDLSGNEYNFLDASAPSGVSYYRIVQYDYDGSSSNTEVISLTRSEVTFGIGNVRPVPARDFVDVTFNAISNADVQLMVHDITGKLIFDKTVEANAGVNVQTLNVDQYAAGIYMITITDGINAETSRFVVK